MLSKSQLHKLTPTELLFLQKHIKLGKDHLETCLTKEELDSLFNLATIPHRAKEQLKTTGAEVLGQSSLVVNSILTATLGGWMGLSGFLQLDMSSKPVFYSVASSAWLLGGFIGFQSGRVRRNQSAAALDKRKLQDLEVAIIQEINRQRKEEIDLKTTELLLMLEHLTIPVKRREIENSHDLQALALKWADALEQRVEEHPRSDFAKYFLLELHEAKNALSIKKAVETEKSEDAEKFSKIADKLSRASMQPQIKLKSWLKANWSRLVVELTPTMLGGFSSLFVYMGGLPNVARAMGNEPLVNFLSDPKVKVLQLIFAVCTTIYFGSSFLYLSRKAFKRDQEISKMQIYITREENMMTVLDDKLLRIKEALRVFEPLEHIMRTMTHKKSA
ncbi:MAG: hypothetical protein ACHQT8_03995 [Chlamydiales bacterium]